MEANEDKVKTHLARVFEWKMKEEHAMGPEDLLEMEENTKGVNGTTSKEKVSRISMISIFQ